MASAKRHPAKHSESDMDNTYKEIKDEILTLLTGQKPDREGNFDYVALAKRVAVLLIAVYGITRVSILRRLAFSIATAYVTKWMADRVSETELLPAMKVA